MINSYRWEVSYFLPQNIYRMKGYQRGGTYIRDASFQSCTAPYKCERVIERFDCLTDAKYREEELKRDKETNMIRLKKITC